MFQNSALFHQIPINEITLSMDDLQNRVTTLGFPEMWGFRGGEGEGFERPMFATNLRVGNATLSNSSRQSKEIMD